jgi:hypothetical protein
LTIYGLDTDPAQLSQTALDGLKKQFAGASATALTGTVSGFAAQGYTVQFTYSGVPMTGTILSFRGGKSSFSLYTQSADSFLTSVQPGFDAVKNSLVLK